MTFNVAVSVHAVMAAGMGIPVVRIKIDPLPGKGITEMNATAEIVLPETVSML